VNMLSTGLSTGFALIALACVVLCYRFAAQASADADGLHKMRVKLMAIEGEYEQLRGQFNKLRGHVYQLRTEYKTSGNGADDVETENESPEAVRARLREQHGLPKIGGKRSDA